MNAPYEAALFYLFKFAILKAFGMRTSKGFIVAPSEIYFANTME